MFLILTPKACAVTGRASHQLARWRGKPAMGWLVGASTPKKLLAIAGLHRLDENLLEQWPSLPFRAVGCVFCGEDVTRVSVRKNRCLRRASLWLFVVFLLAVSPCVSPEALAAPSMNATFPAGSPQVDGTEVRIPFDIAPVTPFATGTVNMVVHFRRNGVDVAQGTRSIPNEIYNTLVNLTHLVYQGLPANYGTSGISLNRTDSTITYPDDTTVSVFFYLDEVTAPSGGDDGGGGGGGGVIPSGGSTTSGTDTGWQRYDSSTDTSTVYVDPELTQELFSQPPPTGVVLVETPVDQEGEVPQNVTANLPLGVVTQGGSVTVPSILNMGSISMELPPSVMQSLAQSVQNLAGGLGSLRVEVIASTPEGTTDTLNSLEDVDLTDMNAASQVITVSFVVVNAQGHETKITVERTSISLSFNPDVVTDPSKVNLYMIGSLIYVGGKVDPVTHQVIADISMTQGGKFVAIEFDKTFSDVTDHWAKGDIELMASKYVVKGMTDTDYWPNSPVTRAQFVTLLVRSLGLSEVAPATPTFQDVAKDTWYYGFVEAAFKAGLAGGDSGSGGRFRPVDFISRQEMSILLTRALKVNGTPAASVATGNIAGLLGRFPDGSAVSEWARSELAQAVNAGLMKGRVDGTFDPMGNGTRAEAATMMSRLMKQAGIL